MPRIRTCQRLATLVATLGVASLAAAAPDVVGGCPGFGDCCEEQNTPGCEDITCCNVVCAQDPFCCEDEWDSLCAGDADELCGSLCGPVCGDTICEPGETWPECPECPPVDNCPGVGDCCDVHASPGCTDESCCDAVCDIDPSCCSTGWDIACVSVVNDACGAGFCSPVCGDTICEPGESWPECPECPPVDNCPGVGDCCDAHASPGCTDEACCNAVCDADPTCCENGWDGACVALVNTQCAPGFCGPVCGDTVCEPGETWPECPECPPVDNCPNAGSCCEEHAGGGCNDENCCDTVCTADPTCCDSSWDASCVGDAVRLCDLCDTNPQPADLDGDGSVGPEDLGILLGAWGGSGAGDIDGDGTVGPEDLGILLGAWS
ncbi:MAG: hypothetical protein JNM94_12790 [Phycisphaerae bacterium]|nr:hypothetical protein [Phycisphaerae bacterium]